MDADRGVFVVGRRLHDHVGDGSCVRAGVLVGHSLFHGDALVPDALRLCAALFAHGVLRASLDPNGPHIACESSTDATWAAQAPLVCNSSDVKTDD